MEGAHLHPPALSPSGPLPRARPGTGLHDREPRPADPPCRGPCPAGGGGAWRVGLLSRPVRVGGAGGARVAERGTAGPRASTSLWRCGEAARGRQRQRPTAAPRQRWEAAARGRGDTAARRRACVWGGRDAGGAREQVGPRRGDWVGMRGVLSGGRGREAPGGGVDVVGGAALGLLGCALARWVRCAGSVYPAAGSGSASLSRGEAQDTSEQRFFGAISAHNCISRPLLATQVPDEQQSGRQTIHPHQSPPLQECLDAIQGRLPQHPCTHPRTDCHGRPPPGGEGEGEARHPGPWLPDLQQAGSRQPPCPPPGKGAALGPPAALLHAFHTVTGQMPSPRSASLASIHHRCRRVAGVGLPPHMATPGSAHWRGRHRPAQAGGGCSAVDADDEGCEGPSACRAAARVRGRTCRAVPEGWADA